MSKSRDIADSAATINFIDGVTSNVQTQLNTLTTAVDNISVTNGSLTKTFTAGETSEITLSSSVLAPVVSVTKEIPQTGATNNKWDAAAGSYALEDSAYATTLDFVGFDVSGASFVDSFSVAGQETAPNGIAFNTDGTKMFVVGSTGDDVNEYTLSTGFDVSTATYSQNFSVASQDTSPQGIAFNNDGTKMFIVGAANDSVYQYALSTGFNVSTASYSQSFSVTSQETDPRGIAFNTNGTKMFIVGGAGDDVNEYSLTTGFDVSTATYSQNFSVTSQDTSPYAIQFNVDGTKMFVCGQSGKDVNEYTLGTGFDVSTASFVDSFSVAAQENNPRGLAFNADGTKMFVVGSTGDAVNEYTLLPSLALGTGSFASTDVGKTINVNDGVLVLTATNGSYAETTAPTSFETAASGEWSMFGVVYDAADDVLEVSNVAVSDAYNVLGASYTGNSFDVSSQETNPRGFAMSNDGTKMYVSGEGSDTIYQYSLSSAYNVSTASYDSVSFDMSPYDTAPQNIVLANNGTKLYVSGEAGHTIEELTLSTAYDLSTATHTRSQSIAGDVSSPKGLFINSDGTKLFTTDSSDNVDAYSMSTAYNVSTLSHVSAFSFATEETFGRSVLFNPDGTKMYICGNGEKIFIYSLSTGFDLTTASYTSTFFDLSSQIPSTPTAMSFAKEGSKIYVISNSSDIVFEYSMETLSIPTGYQPCISSNINSTYWTDINSLTATNAIGDGNVFYAVSNDARDSWSVLDNTDGVRDIVRNNAGTWQYNSNGTYTSETWANASTNTEVAALREAMEGAASGYNIANASYANKSYSPPLGLFYADIAIKSDGTKFYVLHNGTPQALYQYSMSTPFDISTGSYDSVSFTLQDNNVNGIFFRNDGLKFFVVTGTSDTVYAYSCSTAWDLSTASYDSVSFSVSSQDTNPYDISFKSDGTKMFMLGLTNDTVYQYTLSTAWDLSTASYDSVSFSVSSQEASPASIGFNSDGTEMYVLGFSSDSMHQYNLSTAWDLSTASYSNVSFSVASQEATPRGFAFANSGVNFYIVGDTTDLFQYSAPDYTNQMDSTTLNAITDANQITLGDDLDFAAILYYNTGSTVPTYSGTAINYDANILNQGAVLGTDYNFDAPAGDKVRITAVGAGNYKVRVV